MKDFNKGKRKDRMKWVCNECGTVPCYLEVKDSGGETPESCAFNAERYNANWKLTTRTVELKKQRDELLQFVEWVLAVAARQRNGEGGDLRTIQHTAEALLTRIKEGE